MDLVTGLCEAYLFISLVSFSDFSMMYPLSRRGSVAECCVVDSCDRVATHAAASRLLDQHSHSDALNGAFDRV